MSYADTLRETQQEEFYRRGDEIKKNAVSKKLAKLSKEYYIGKVRQGMFVKTSNMERNHWKKQFTLSAA